MRLSFLFFLYRIAILNTYFKVLERYFITVLKDLLNYLLLFGHIKGILTCLFIKIETD